MKSSEPKKRSENTQLSDIRQLFDLFERSANIILRGFIDSFSLGKLADVLVNSPPTRDLAFKCLLANGFLLVGSILIFEKGVLPAVALFGEKVLDGKEQLKNNSTFTNHIIYSFYHGLWVIPIWVICYLSSSVWYQQIANEIYKFKSRTGKTPDITKAVANATYALLVWLFAFIEIQLFTNILPLLFNQLNSLVSSYYTNFHHFSIVFRIFLMIIQNISHLFSAFGFVLLCIVYGWYGFDYHWISDGTEPDKRFKIVEDHWLYFFGFGLPYGIIVKITSFFVGYGLYLGLFPFCIILGCLNDYQYTDETDKKVIPSLPLFFYPKKLTIFSIKLIENLTINKNKFK